jgi:hypothetical protein
LWNGEIWIGLDGMTEPVGRKDDYRSLAEVKRVKMETATAKMAAFDWGGRGVVVWDAAERDATSILPCRSEVGGMRDEGEKRVSGCAFRFRHLADLRGGRRPTAVRGAKRDCH